MNFLNRKSSEPLFILGLSFLIGVSFALSFHWVYIFPLALLCFLFDQKISVLVFALLAFCYTSYLCPKLSFEKIEGEGVFRLETIQPSSSPFAKGVMFKGVFEVFKTENQAYSNIPCTFFPRPFPPTGTKWILKGRLENKERVVFKPLRNSEWIPLPSSFSLARWRYQVKEKIRHFLYAHCKDQKVAHFFSAMATGEVDDRLLSMEFRKVGLSHILAISGFHFALIAAVWGWFLYQLLPPKIASLSLLSFLFIYLVFLGATPSIVRAFVMIALYILGKILHRKPNVLNLLGLALLIELIQNPRTSTTLSFQLSFLATAGILLFYTPFNQFLEKFFPKRSIKELNTWNSLNQYGYLFSSGIRQALALDLAVHSVTLPLIFFLFHSYSFLAVPYGLIFPPILSLSLFFLFLTPLFPFLYWINVSFTSWILRLIASPPELLNFQIFIHHFPYPLLILLLSFVLGIGLTKRGKTGYT